MAVRSQTELPLIVISDSLYFQKVFYLLKTLFHISFIVIAVDLGTRKC